MGSISGEGIFLSAVIIFKNQGVPELFIISGRYSVTPLKGGYYQLSTKQIKFKKKHNIHIATAKAITNKNNMNQ